MDQVVKQKWVEALRSGRYEQTTGVLCDGSAMCCLGVLCDVVDPDGWTFDKQIHQGESGTPSEHLSEQVGLPLDYQDLLVAMNDDEKKTFLEIADWIEGNL